MAVQRTFLLETDQTQCYDEDGQSIACQGTGQDASHDKLDRLHSARRFQVGEYTVVDELSGAVWSRNANPAEFPLSWDEARQVVADMRLNRVHRIDDWQLPSRRLLFTLISHQHINPALALNHPFQDVFTGYYWTADTCRRLPDQAWYVHLGGGRVHRGMKHGSYLVWPVSPGRQAWANTGQSGGFGLMSNDAGVTDHRTALVWSRDADPVGRETTWPEALAAIEDFNHSGLGGRHDWRLPNIRELESLVDLGTHSPALPGGHPFVNVRDAYWSSTTSVYEARYAWTLYSRDGGVGVGFKPGPGFHVWPVCSADGAESRI